MILQISLSLYLVGAILVIVIWAALLLGFFKVSKRTKKKRPVPETFTFFQPKQGGSFKHTDDLIISSRLDDLDTKIVSYQNSLIGKKLKPAALPIEEYSEFASNYSEQQFALFSNEAIQASVTQAQQNLEEIIARRKERQAELFEFEQLLEAMEDQNKIIE
jgi:hypothetical protein